MFKRQATIEPTLHFDVTIIMFIIWKKVRQIQKRSQSKLYAWSRNRSDT